MQNEIMTTAQAAQFLGLRTNTLEIWRYRGTGPQYLKLGRAVRYRLSDLEDFIQACTKQKTNSGDCISNVVGLRT